jgi:hypothetical protein
MGCTHSKLKEKRFDLEYLENLDLENLPVFDENMIKQRDRYFKDAEYNIQSNRRPYHEKLYKKMKNILNSQLECELTSIDQISSLDRLISLIEISIYTAKCYDGELDDRCERYYVPKY